jgi:hypothetical protein
MPLKRGLLGICLGSVCALGVACGNTSGGAGGGSGGAGAGTAGLGEAGAGDAAAQGGSGAGGSADSGNAGSAGATSSGSGGALAQAGTAGDLGNAGEGGAPDDNGGSSGGVGGSSSAGTSGSAGIGGGSAGSAGTGGAGGLSSKSSKLDVLLVIDNSASMADKQGVLEQTLPAFIKRLTNPLCVDANRVPVATQPTLLSQPCVTGTREFVANDIHVGVISTSLGAHGGYVCSTNITALDTLDDQAELLGKLRPGLTTWQNSGFLSWDPSGVTGSSNAADLTTDLTADIVAAGEHGCGYEAPLEAMYRFLIDPEPPAMVTKVGNATVRQGTNTELLAERAAFLRPDSAVAILALSDENDCSIRDDGVGWFVGATTHMPKATVACATNPNDACCRSCAQVESAPPSGCAPLTQDPVCMGAAPGTYIMWDNANDSLNLRCFDQKARFGFDLLYPTTRYASGLSDLTIANNEGALVKNPLFFNSAGVQTRLPSLVTLSVMVGVPWQDLATTQSLAGGKLEYLDAAGLTAQGRWPVLLGDPSNFVKAQDPLMVESIAPRTGTQPILDVPLAPASSTNPAQNPINGHEQNIANNDDLQYACIFKLPASRSCTPGDSECDCSPSTGGDATQVTTYNSPVCQPPAGGVAGTTQYYAKAYPGLRELDVAHRLGERGVPTSICAKTLTATDADFGYTPAFDALLKRVSVSLE